MGQRMVHFSDLTNTIIEDHAVVRIVVEQHPALQNGPVAIEVSEDEVVPVRKGALDIVNLKIFMDDGSEPETVTMEVEAFNKLAGDKDMVDIIRRAQPAYPPPNQLAATPATEKLKHASLEHAGKPHQGKITNMEQAIRNDLDADSSQGLRSRGSPMEWMKRSGRCEVCGDPMGRAPSGERASRRQAWVDTSGTDRVFVRRGDVCTDCWQRHLDLQQSRPHRRQIMP
ncbi:MAG: hypothetical protein JO287_00675 [Pseudonocardiales bacterium]|nr:hypothetical protein [Pseudonocardiales bacterium]